MSAYAWPACEFGVLGPVVAWDGAGRPDRPEGPAAPGGAGPADRRPRPGRPGRPPGRRPVGRPAGGRGERGADVRRRAAPGARAGPARRGHRPGCWSPRAPGYALARPTPSTPGGSRQAVRARRCRAASCCRLTRRWRWWRGPAYADFADEPGRGRALPADRAAAARGRAPGRGAARRWAGRRGRARLDAHVDRAPLARGRLAAAGARAVPHRPPGRRARGPAPRPDAAGRAARRRSRPGAAAGWRPTSSTRPTHLEPASAGRVWAEAAAAYDRTVAPAPGRGWSRRSGCCATSR